MSQTILASMIGALKRDHPGLAFGGHARELRLFDHVIRWEFCLWVITGDFEYHRPSCMTDWWPSIFEARSALETQLRECGVSE